MSPRPSRFFVHHDPHSPLPHPGPSYTRFVCLSDTHSRLFRVPPGDVLLHAGDLCSWGRVSDLRKTIDWLKSLPHPVKIIIAGNHDLCLDKGWASMCDTAAAKALVQDSSARKAGIIYLEHEATHFTTAQGRQWCVYGSPAAPHYADGAFQYNTHTEARDIYAQIPMETEILLTHTPPYEVHDTTHRGKHAGCKVLAARLEELEGVPASATDLGLKEDANGALAEQKTSPWNCRLHVWGHIHEAHGASIKHQGERERVQVNAALANEGTPIIVDLHNDSMSESLNTSYPSLEGAYEGA